MKRFSWICVVVIVSFASGHTDALHCYNCTDANSLNNCHVTECSPGEVCRKQMTTSDDSQTTHSTLSCTDAQNCVSTTVTAPVIGRSLKTNRATHCNQCCSTDACNINLCTQSKQCLDGNNDCAQLNSILNICADIHHAKLICKKTCNLCDLVDGKWADWSNWGQCSVTCGTGIQQRIRTCTNPAPEHGGLDCVGNSSETDTSCVLDPCPINGGWRVWSDFGQCSVTCGIGLKSQHRTCTNPVPAFGGTQCDGDQHQDSICINTPCANGGWSNWSSWGSCSITCGGGFRTRSRSCSNPTPSILGRECQGDSKDVGACNGNVCPVLTSMFTVNSPSGYTNNRLTFATTVTNSGDFSVSTGTFTCSQPGNYYFEVTLVKKGNDSIDYVSCWLYKNSAQLVFIYADPADGDHGGDYGTATATNSAVVHLNHGDTVYLTRCTAPISMRDESSFTGFLIQPDN